MIVNGKFKLTSLEERISKNNKRYRIIKLLDDDGDVTEMFVNDKCIIPNGIKKLEDVDAEIKITTDNNKIYITLQKLEICN